MRRRSIAAAYKNIGSAINEKGLPVLLRNGVTTMQVAAITMKMSDQCFRLTSRSFMLFEQSTATRIG
jgi:hypothetical protein